MGPASENGTTFRGNDNEAQKLREKALEALHSLKSMGSNEDEADAVALPEGTTGMGLAIPPEILFSLTKIKSNFAVPKTQSVSNGTS